MDNLWISAEPVDNSERITMEHELKCWPEFFQAVLDGRKTFEIRRNDRDYRMGDTIRLREYNHTAAYALPPEQDYTGREIFLTITYVLTAVAFPEAIKDGYCVVAIKPR